MKESVWGMLAPWQQAVIESMVPGTAPTSEEADLACAAPSPNSYRSPAHIEFEFLRRQAAGEPLPGSAASVGRNLITGPGYTSAIYRDDYDDLRRNSFEIFHEPFEGLIGRGEITIDGRPVGVGTWSITAERAEAALVAHVEAERERARVRSIIAEILA